MTYLGIDEFREALEGVGFSAFEALEKKNKGWFAVKCRNREEDTDSDRDAALTGGRSVWVE